MSKNTDTIIIGGAFNTTLNTQIDRESLSKRKRQHIGRNKLLKTMAKQRKDKEKELKMKLFRLEEKIGNDADENTFALYESVKNELITIASSKAKGTILRSKVRWHEKGEKSTKYFANMEKRNFNSKHITELESDDEVTTTVEK